MCVLAAAWADWGHGPVGPRSAPHPQSTVSHAAAVCEAAARSAGTPIVALQHFSVIFIVCCFQLSLSAALYADYDKPGHGGVVTAADAAAQMAEGEANAKVHSMALAGNDAAEVVDDAAQESLLSADAPSSGGELSAVQRVADSALAALHAGADESEGVVTADDAHRQMQEGEANASMHAMAQAGDEAAQAALDTAAGDGALTPGDKPPTFDTRVEERQSESAST